MEKTRIRNIIGICRWLFAAASLLGMTSVLILLYTHDNSISLLKHLIGTSPGSDVTRKLSILCLILTSPSGKNKMATVKITWAKGCDKYLFIYGQTDASKKDESFLYVPVKEARQHLTGKVRHALEYAYQTYNDTFDWILKCDDDTYVIVENLRYLLTHADPDKPGYLGFHMKTTKTRRTGYMSGGGGYVISSRGLRQLVTMGFQNDTCRKDGGDEDVEIGLCLAISKVPVLKSLDTDRRQTFHPEPLSKLLYPPHPEWVNTYSWNKDSKNFGPGCCSKYSITFHHLSADMLLMTHHLLYKTKVFGLIDEQIDEHPVFDPHVVKPAY